MQQTMQSHGITQIWDMSETRAVLWRRHWPAKLVAIIAIIQLFLTINVIGLEGYIIGLDLAHANEFTISDSVFNAGRFNYDFGRYGLAAIFFYMITWISTFTVGKKGLKYKIFS